MSSTNMAPSRGDGTRRQSFTGAPIVPPTLGPFLDNLPSPTSTIRDQRTPTGPPANGISSRSIPASPTPSPSRLNHFDLPEDEDEVALDDEEFQSHYSRHSSPASSASGSDEEDVSNIPLTRPSSPAGDGNVLYQTRSLTGLPQHLQTRPGLHTSQSTTSLPTAPPIPLYPPFYNRPPTPLPPSPSLTSLLRPPSLLNRSTASTRPTSPDSSDAETPADTDAAIAQSARRAKPLAPTSPKVPTYEYYGFAVYLGSSLAFLLYILWSYLPSAFLHALGVTYYPNRWWSLAIPSWIVMLLVFVYVALLSYNVEYLTLGMGSVECMVDEAANVALVDEYGRLIKGGSKRLVADQEKIERRRASIASQNSRRKGKARASTSSRKPPTAVAIANGNANGSINTDPYEASHQAWNWRGIWNEGTDAVMDVPLGGVCEVLYSSAQ